MSQLKFIGLFILSHGGNQNQQGVHVPFMWPVALIMVWWHFHVAGLNFEKILTLKIIKRQRAIPEDGCHHTVVWQRYCRKLTFRLVGPVLFYASGSVCNLASFLGARTGCRFVGITLWPGGEWEKAYVVLLGVS